MNKSILVIDSGVGGLTTLAKIRKKLFRANVIYFADDTFLPYGSKTKQEIVSHLCEIISNYENEISAVVLACNTATGAAIDALRKIFCFPIIGTEPAVALACKTEGRSAVLVTPLESRQDKFLKLVNDKNVFVLPMNSLAKKIDDCLTKCNDFEALQNCVLEDVCKVKELLEQIKIKKVVLGCTHYVFLRYTSLFSGFELYDGNDGVASRLMAFVEDIGDKKTEIIFGSGNEKKSQIALKLFCDLLLFDFCL